MSRRTQTVPDAIANLDYVRVRSKAISYSACCLTTWRTQSVRLLIIRSS